MFHWWFIHESSGHIQKKSRSFEWTWSVNFFNWTPQHTGSLWKSLKHSIYFSLSTSNTIKLNKLSKYTSIHFIYIYQYKYKKVNVKFLLSLLRLSTMPRLLGKHIKKIRGPSSQKKSVICFLNMTTTDIIFRKNHIHLNIYTFNFIQIRF